MTVMANNGNLEFLPSDEEHEYESPVSPTRMFRAAVLDWHVLGPKIAPDIIKSTALLEGKGNSIESVRPFNFIPVMPFWYVKERMDFLNNTTFESKWSKIKVIRLMAAPLGPAAAQYCIEPTITERSVCRVVVDLNLTPVEEVTEKHDNLKQFRTTEAYLIRNLNTYV